MGGKNGRKKWEENIVGVMGEWVRKIGMDWTDKIFEIKLWGERG